MPKPTTPAPTPVEKTPQEQAFDLAEIIDKVPAGAFTTLFQAVLDDHDRRCAEHDTFSPWDEARKLIEAGELKVRWSTITGADGNHAGGMIYGLHDGTHEIHLQAVVDRWKVRSWHWVAEVLAHELEHRRRNLVFPRGCDPRFVAEAEVIVEAYALSRLGRGAGAQSPAMTGGGS